MSLQIATVANSISNLSITGLTIEDLDDISVFVTKPTLSPLDTFISNLSVTYDSYGSGDVAKMTVGYDLSYRLYYAPVGSNRELKNVVGLVDMIAAIWDAILGIVNLTGAVEIVPAGNIRMGIVAAPDGTAHFGCDLAFRVTEFVN